LLSVVFREPNRRVAAISELVDNLVSVVAEFVTKLDRMKAAGSVLMKIFHVFLPLVDLLLIFKLSKRPRDTRERVAYRKLKVESELPKEGRFEICDES
jgi:hypothetical protein